jgi:hypothetical protein
VFSNTIDFPSASASRHFDLAVFPVHAQDASGWRHATYFYKDAFEQWHSTLDLIPIE